jgi:hypothetical protein
MQEIELVGKGFGVNDDEFSGMVAGGTMGLVRLLMRRGKWDRGTAFQD